MNKKVALAALSMATAAAAVTAVPSAVGAGAGADLSTSADVIWDVTTPDPNVRHTGPVRALVWDMEEYGDQMFVAGRFLEVKAPDGTTRDQSYLASFDLETGEWIDTFRPDVDGIVYSIEMSGDGRLLAGGELDGGVVAYDPQTGVRDASFRPGILNSWGPPAVFDIEVAGDHVFVGGTFTRAQGVALSNLAKLDLAGGTIDPSWTPQADLDVGTPRLGGKRVYALAVDPPRDRVYVAGKFGGIDGNDEAAYFATLDMVNGDLRAELPQGLPTGIPNHRGGFSMWMQDVQFDDDHVYLGGQAHQTMIMDLETLQVENTWFTNRGIGDPWGGGDTQVIFVGEDTVWSGCHCWGSVGPYPLGSYIADPGGRQTYDEYREWVRDFGTIDPFGQQKVRGGFGVDIDSRTLLPLTFDLVGRAGAYAIVEDSNGRVWFGGQYDRDPVAGRQIEGIARFSPAGLVAAPSGLRSTLVTRERAVMTWDRLAGAVSYEVLRDGVVAGSSASVWFVARDLDAGTSYEFTVRGVFADGSVTPESTAITVETQGGPNDQSPSGLRSTLVTRERAVMTWDRLAGAVSYEVLRDGVVAGSSASVWFVARDLDAGTSYEFTVRGVFADGSVTPESTAITVETNP